MQEVKGFDENTLFSPYTKQQWRSYQQEKINQVIFIIIIIEILPYHLFVIKSHKGIKTKFTCSPFF